MKSTIQMDEVETPRKRRRDSDNCIFTNAAFSSTPKKPIVAAARRLPKPQPAPRASKENANPNPFFINAGLEVKSIAESATQQSQNAETVNPFEVVRKPPKKKKRDEEMKEACFENPALNLEMPEKLFNPFEVVRTPVVPVPRERCFVNEALNLRGQDIPAARNPYEIHRNVAVDSNNSNAGVTNMALEEGAAPTKLQIGLPFTPTLGCRIDFKNISLSKLTPSRLLADKLIFSPVPPPKRSLDAVSEASTTLDIGKELDRYQLELENSINEAKLRRNGCGDLQGARDINFSPELIVQTATVEQKVTFTQKLAEIAEDEEDEDVEEKEEQQQLQTIVNEKTIELEVIQEETELKISTELKPSDFKHSGEEKSEEDVAYASESEEELEEDFDFKAPAHFVRAYRRDNNDAAEKLTISKESLNSIKSHKSTASSEGVDEEHHKKSKNVKNMIRRSIRKLMHPLQSKECTSNPEQPQEKHRNNAATNMINTLRHSLRRKVTKQLLVEDESTIDAGKSTPADISIIDSSERTMKLKSQMPQMEYARIEELTNERKHSLRSSLRHSTRGMRDQLMRTVFHKKHEEYAFCK